MKLRWQMLLICLVTFCLFYQETSFAETGIEHTMDSSWTFLSENEGEPTTYGKGSSLRFMLEQLDPHGDSALKWATDELQAVADRGGSIKQQPREIQIGNRKWYEIRSEQNTPLGPMVFVQWFLQNETNLIHAMLAGPDKEVEANLESIQKVLAGIKIVVASKEPKWAKVANFVDIWRACRLSTFQKTSALSNNEVINEMSMLPIVTTPEELIVPKGKPVIGYMLISKYSRFFANGPKPTDIVADSEEILYTKKKDLSDGTIIFGGAASNEGYVIKEVKYLGEGSMNITSDPVPAKFYEVVIEANR